MPVTTRRSRLAVLIPFVCGLAAATTAAQAPHAQTASPGEIAVRRLCDEAFGAGKLGVIDDLVLETYTCSGPTPADSPQSRAALKASVRALRADFTDVTAKVRSLTSKGKLVTLGWAFSGTYAGTDIPDAKGRKVSHAGTSVFTISADGKIASERCSWDTLDVLRQLGAEAMPDPKDAMIANAHRLLEDVYGKGDTKALAEIVTDDYLMHVPAIQGATVERGIAAAEKRVKAFRAAMPDLKFQIHEDIVSGDTLVMRWSFRGTHRGEFLGVAPTGKPIEITGMSLSRSKNGKVAEIWVEWDRNRLLEQVGASPVR